MQGTRKTLCINERLSNNIYSTGFYSVKPREGIVTQKCLYYLIDSGLFLKEKDKNCSGATQKAINNHGLKQIEINVPKYADQIKIETQLDLLSRMIKNAERQLQYLDALVKAQFVEMFGSIREARKVGDFCDLQNGHSFKSSDYVDKSTTFNCRMSNIRPGGFFAPEYHPKFLPDSYWDSYSDFRLMDGDVIIAMTDMANDPKILGLPTIVNTNGRHFLLNQRVGKLIFNDDIKINKVYLLNALMQDGVHKELVQNSGGSTQINIGKPAILNLTIKYPSIQLQNQFATFVQQVDKSKFAVLLIGVDTLKGMQ